MRKYMKMTAIIFAGGAGTRLWPISRKNSPKQFATIKDNKSTLQMAYDRIADIGSEQIYVSTNEAYKDIVKKQLPDLADDHILLEPAKRDQGPAVALTLLRLKERGVTGPISILWSDHLMDHPDKFLQALKKAATMIEAKPDRFVFLGETPRFANHNLGWIYLGNPKSDAADEQEYTFAGWKYRPEIALCEKMFHSGKYLWNTGYFVTDIDFLLGLYETHQQEMLSSLQTMIKEKTFEEQYVSLPSISFDNAIIENIDLSQGTVLKVNLGWSDPGTLYAFKEAFVPEKEKNYEKGNVFTLDSHDSFVYNEEEHKLVTTIGLDGIVVVNTKDGMLVCKKEDVPRVKELLKNLEDKGLEEYL